MQILKFLERTDLFAGVTADALSRIAGDMEGRRVAAGSVLFHKGDVGDAVYFVVEGHLHLEAGGISLLTRGPGECIGEFALIDDVPRSASAVADTDARVLVWSRDAFRRALGESPQVVAGVFRVLTTKLRQDIAIQANYVLEQERWKQDLERARQIQAGMLPAEELSTAVAEVSGCCRPAHAVGGDYFDYLEVDEHTLGLMIGDVTGHGFYSALFVAMAKSCLHTQAEIEHAPARIMAALRRTLSLSPHRRLLMSCCYLVIDGRARTLTYANAGHPYPYLYRRAGGRLRRLPAVDPILGAQGADAPMFTERRRRLAAGDLVILYTDGITEACDQHGDPFGHERLEASILAHPGCSARQLKEAILAAVSRHCGDEAQRDDLTLVIARVA